MRELELTEAEYTYLHELMKQVMQNPHVVIPPGHRLFQKVRDAQPIGSIWPADRTLTGGTNGI